MTVVVIRLQGLTIEAGSEDIRKFFHGLHIPEGGVHITGGDVGEAFIIFQSEREAQLAMRNSGKLLRGSSVLLHISSLAELKRKMESRLRKANTPAVENKAVPSVSFSPEINGKLLLTLMAALQGQLSNNNVNESQAPNQKPEHIKQTVQQPSPEDQTNADFTHTRVTHRFASTGQESGGQNNNTSKPGYLRLYGLPDFVVERDVRHFLRELSVSGVITNVRLPLGFCCLVKLASFAEAEKGLKYNHRKFKEFDIEVRPAHEKMWTDAEELSGKCEHDVQSHAFSEPRKINVDRNAHNTHFSRKRSVEKPSSSGSPKRYCQNSPPHTELYVIVNNLSKNITKTEIKNIFSCPEIHNSRIKHLLNKWGERTTTAFITFEHAEDYAAALNMNGTTVGLKNIEVSSITREEMFAILSRNRFTKIWRPQPYRKAKDDLLRIYARNFPANVTKIKVRDFFTQFQVCENDIRLLVDSQGNGIGEAIVEFGCEKIARQAQKVLHGMHFMGTKILLTCISRQQMEEILGTQ